MTTDDPGIWLYRCHVSDHIVAGMQTRYQVTPSAFSGGLIGAPRFELGTSPGGR
ncbi:MAG: Multicopper oxidase, partial [Solirubrobacteraceae bacterium]|nr:Multicopper oxidase [Solirubrobacteraceae bacterium]